MGNNSAAGCGGEHDVLEMMRQGKPIQALCDKALTGLSGKGVVLVV